MPVPDKDVVRRVLATNDRDIACHNAVKSAWAAVKSKYQEQAWWRRKSTTAAVMWEESVNNAIDVFDRAPGVHIVRHHDTVSFVFQDTVLARFKRASIKLHTANYPTPLAKLFHWNEVDLFGFEGYHRVEIAHVIDRYGTGLDWIGVVAHDRDRVLWSYELPSGGAAIEPFPVPYRPSPAADTVLRPAKPAPREKTGDEPEEK